MVRIKRPWLLSGLALLLAACGGGAPPQDLALSEVSPNSPTVVQGQRKTLTLTFTSQNGFQGQVTLSVTENGQPPSWLSLSPTSKSLNVPKGGQVQESLRVQVTRDAPIGPHALKLRATYGNQTAELDLSLTVTTYAGPYVYQVSQDGSVLVGSARVGGDVKPTAWRIDVASLSPGFYWLNAIAAEVLVLDTGSSDAPYGVVLGVTADGQVGCGYASQNRNASSGDVAVYWDLMAERPFQLPGFDAGNVAYACAKSGNDVYIVGRVRDDVPDPTIWKNGTFWERRTDVIGIFHDITPDARKASAQIEYQGFVYDLTEGQYTRLISTIDGAYWSRISPDGQAVAFSDSNSYPAAKVWYGGNVYSVGMSIGAVRVRNGVAYVFGGSSDGLNAVRWRSDTQTLENLNTVFAGVLPQGVTLKTASAVSLDNQVIVGIARNPNTNQDEPFVLVGDPFQAAP